MRAMKLVVDILYSWTERLEDVYPNSLEVKNLRKAIDDVRVMVDPREGDDE